jgi:hypothetical protein
MSRVVRNNRVTPYIDAWKARLNALLSQPGSRSELARWLADNDKAKVQFRKVQIAKVLNGRTVPDGEFVLSVNDWLLHQKQKIGR